HTNTKRLAEGLCALDGVERLFDGLYFHEVAVRLDRPVAPVLEALASQNILGGYDLSKSHPQFGDAMLVCATETKTDADIDAYVTALDQVLKNQTETQPRKRA
ncbi:MAG: glycine dehydrogenase, partial [Gammaproteobacteria bacterium]|nr:glycine dehydrogenase [Gammaproteobacteria bacterium]